MLFSSFLVKLRVLLQADDLRSHMVIGSHKFVKSFFIRVEEAGESKIGQFDLDINSCALGVLRVE